MLAYEEAAEQYARSLQVLETSHTPEPAASASCCSRSATHATEPAAPASGTQALRQAAALARRLGDG